MNEQKYTIPDLLLGGAGEHIAIAGPGRAPLSYQALRELAARTVRDMNAIGIGRNAPVAIVLPNGPEMAAAFIAVASGATTAPLNPAYREKELEFYLLDLQAKALIVQSGMQSPARAVAARLGIVTLDLVPDPNGPAGAFTLAPGALAGTAPAAAFGMAEPDDVALVLHTSGTTARPKMVPLSHANITASALHIGAA